MAILTGLDIVYDGLTFCIDPHSKLSIPGATADSVVSSVTDVSRSGISVGGGSGQYRDNDTSTEYRPYYRSAKDGTMEFSSSGAGSATENYNYGYLDCDDAIDNFGVDDPWTVDLWFKQKTFNYDYFYQAGNLASPASVYTSYYTSGYPNFSYTRRYPLRVSIAWMDNGNQTYRVGFESCDKIVVNTSTTTHQYSCTAATTNLDTNTWYHVCGVMDTGNTLSNSADNRRAYAYVNGVASNASNVDGEIDQVGSSTPSYSNSNDFLIGASSSNNSYHDDLRSNGAHGHLGAFKIYNRALTASEVLQNYNSLKKRYQ